MNGEFKMRTIVFIAGLFCLTVNACKDIEPDDGGNESPVFYALGYIDQAAFSAKAGEGDYFMETDYVSDQGVYEFQGSLQKKCEGCKESFNIKLRSNKQTTNPGELHLDSVFGNLNYAFYPPPPDTNIFYLVKFNQVSSGAGVASHVWGFGDGTFSTELNPVKKYASGKSYQVTYVVSYSSGCVSDITYEVNALTTNDARFSYSTVDSSTINFNADSPAVINIWDFGDGQNGLGNNLNHTYGQPGKYKVCLVQYRTNDTVKACQNILTPTASGCKANFNYTSAKQTLPGILHLSEVTVEWVDANGVFYSSRNIKQDAGSYFRILESADYFPNSKGQRTRKFTFETSCLLSDGLNKIRLSDTKGVMCVGLP